MDYKPKTNTNNYTSKQFGGNKIQQTLNKKRAQSSDKDQYYKFYLESAQRAIEMMRKKHRVITKNDELITDYKSHDNYTQVYPEPAMHSNTAINFNTNYDMASRMVNQDRVQSVQYNRNNKSKRILEPIPNKSITNIQTIGKHESPDNNSTKFTQFDHSNPGGQLGIINERNINILKQKVNVQQKPYSAGIGKRTKQAISKSMINHENASTRISQQLNVPKRQQLFNNDYP